MRLPNLHTAPMRHLIKIRTFLKKADFYGKNRKFMGRFKGLTLGQIFLNLEQIYNTRQRFRPLTQNYFSAFRFRAQGTFYLSLFIRDNPPPPAS